MRVRSPRQLARPPRVFLGLGTATGHHERGRPQHRAGSAVPSSISRSSVWSVAPPRCRTPAPPSVGAHSLSPFDPTVPPGASQGPRRPPAGQGGVCQAHVLTLDGCPGLACPCPDFRLSPQTIIPASPAHQVSTSFSHCPTSGVLLAQPSCPDTCPYHQQFPNGSAGGPTQNSHVLC